MNAGLLPTGGQFAGIDISGDLGFRRDLSRQLGIGRHRTEKRVFKAILAAAWGQKNESPGGAAVLVRTLPQRPFAPLPLQCVRSHPPGDSLVMNLDVPKGWINRRCGRGCGQVGEMAECCCAQPGKALGISWGLPGWRVAWLRSCSPP